MTKILGVPPTPIDKMFSPRIWTNLNNDPDNVKNCGIPRIRGSLTCVLFYIFSLLNPPITKKMQISPKNGVGHFAN